MYKEIIKNAIRSKTPIRKAREDAGAMEMGKLAVGVIVAVVIIVIAVSLLPAIFTATTGALTSNITSNSHYSSSVTLVYLIPLIFVAGLLVMIVYMMFTRE